MKRTVVYSLVLIIVIGTLLVMYFVPKKNKIDQDVVDKEVQAKIEKYGRNSFIPEGSPTDISIYELTKILTPNFDYWNDWTMADKMVEIVIKDVSASDNYLTGYIRNPKNEEFSGVKRTFFPECHKDQTVSVASNAPTTKVLKGNFNIVEEATTGDSLFAYCLDEQCLTIGKKCILIDFE